MKVQFNLPRVFWGRCEPERAEGAPALGLPHRAFRRLSGSRSATRKDARGEKVSPRAFRAVTRVQSYSGPPNSFSNSSSRRLRGKMSFCTWRRSSRIPVATHQTFTSITVTII